MSPAHRRSGRPARWRLHLAARRALLDLRVRVYVEDHLSPDFDEMGNFYFRRKAWVMERAGLFYDASFRRRLTGYSCDRV